MSTVATDPTAALAGALSAARGLLEADSRLQALEELLKGLERQEFRSPERLGSWLVDFCGEESGRRADVTDLLGFAAGELTVALDPSGGGPTTEALEALKLAAEQLHGQGAWELGRLSVAGPERLDLLREEASHQLPVATGQTVQVAGAAGEELSNLAVSRKLRRELFEALGFPVFPTYNALYLYDPPGSYVRPHLDARDQELSLHLILEHTFPRGSSSGSALVVHRAGQRAPQRTAVQPGEAVIVQSRGTVHAWEQLASDESRTSISIGFTATQT